jgi:predicted Holliday junction resolvase-like endonuclease
VFVEVKTGGAGLTGRERRVREGEVEWVELRVGTGERGVA